MRRLRTPSVAFFLLSVACGALCQSQLSCSDLLQGLVCGGAGSDEAQLHALRTWKSLPDAPSAQPATQAEKFRAFIDEARSPLTFGAAGVDAGIMRGTEVGSLSFGRQASLTDLYKGALIQKESSAFFSKYLYPALLKQDPRYHPSNSQSFWGRVMYAASRTVITRNDSGKATLNTSYFLGVLTSVAISTAYRPYASNFVSTGGDIYTLQRILGHKSISMTQRYAHLSPAYRSAAVNRMNNLWQSAASVASPPKPVPGPPLVTPASQPPSQDNSAPA